MTLTGFVPRRLRGHTSDSVPSFISTIGDAISTFERNVHTTSLDLGGHSSGLQFNCSGAHPAHLEDLLEVTHGPFLFTILIGVEGESFSIVWSVIRQYYG